MGFELRFTDKEITAWGGMGLMKRMLDRIGFDSALEACDFPKPGSNRGYSPIQLLLQFMLSVWCGVVRIGLNIRRLPVMTRCFRNCLASNAWRTLKQSCGCSESLIKRL